MSTKFGEIKTGKNFYPKDAKKIVEKGEVGIIISLNPLSNKTNSIFLDNDVTVYHDVDIEKIREIIKEQNKEIESNENKERE